MPTKNMKILLLSLLCIGFLNYSSLLYSEGLKPPALRIEQVVQRVKEFLKEEQNKDLRVKNCFIKQVEYKEIAKDYSSSYWSIFVSGKGATWNCMGEIRIFNDGSIIRVVGY